MARTISELMERRLSESGLDGWGRKVFLDMYRAYMDGEVGYVDWRSVVKPAPEDLVELSSLKTGDMKQSGCAKLGELAWVVLNGGLGTSMKMSRAKTLVPVKGQLTFLDLICRYVKGRREKQGIGLPLIFMNSFATSGDTMEAVGAHGMEVAGSDGEPLPLEFMQNRFPRIRQEDGEPLTGAAERELWAPPGHGDLYACLAGSGLLDRLLASGYRWTFVSNGDNLGAYPDPTILGYMASRSREFLMEVTPKTPADVKGGTLVRREGRLELLEIAQVGEGDRDKFQDIGTFPAFNTNNVWIDLAALKRKLAEGPLDLRLIVNRKLVGSAQVVQLESAMGAAVGCFEASAGVVVGRDRFAPVKTIDDLAARRSDLFEIGEDSPLAMSAGRDPEAGPVVVNLDEKHYGSVDQLDRRIPHPLGLVEATSLTVRGPVTFGRGVRVRGDALVENPSCEELFIGDGSVLGG